MLFSELLSEPTQHKHIVIVRNDINNIALFQEIHALYLLFLYIDLLKCFLIHEHISVITFLIKELIWTFVYTNILQFESLSECTLQYLACLYILHFGTHKGVALPGFT